MENEYNEAEVEDFDTLEIEESEPVESVDWKATAMRYKKQLSKQKTTTTKSLDTSNYNVQQQIARLELKTEGYSDESINFLEKVGGKASLSDPHVKAAIDSIQEQKNAEKAAVGTQTAKSEIESKYSPEEISQMSAEELYKILPKSKQ